MSKSVRIMVAALALALLPSLAKAQGGTISGTVVDAANQQPLQDAQVSVVGTQRGAATDQRGRFRLLLEPGRYETAL